MTRNLVLALALVACKSAPEVVPTEPTPSEPVPSEPEPLEPPDNADSHVGMNLGVPEFRGDALFVDLVRNAPGFRSTVTWELVDVGPQGYPLAVSEDEPVWLEVFGEHGAPFHPTGTYVMLYRGTGDVTVDAPGVQLGAEQLQDDGRVRVEVTLDPSSWPAETDAYITITSSDAVDPIRDVHLIPPGFEDTWETEPFHPDALSKWARYGVMRPLHATAFWDFPDTELVPDVDWADRMQPDDARHGLKWSYEAMIDLSNELDTDLWLTVPHTATLAYTTQLAELTLDRLEPGRGVYIEFANECWNAYSNTHEYAVAQGLASGLSPHDTEDSGYLTGLHWCAVQTVEHTNTFRSVFEAAGEEDRVTRVMGGFVGNDWLYQRQDESDGEGFAGALHEVRTSTGRPAYQDVDAVAIANYFGGELGIEEVAERAAQWSVDDAVTYFATGTLPEGTPPSDEFDGGVPGTLERVRVWREVADGLGLQLLGYEGGPHFVADTAPEVSALYHQVLEDPRMADLVEQLVTGSQENGMDRQVLFVTAEPHVAESPWLRFGFVEHGLCETDDQWRWQGVERFLDAQ